MDSRGRHCVLRLRVESPSRAIGCEELHLPYAKSIVAREAVIAYLSGKDKFRNFCSRLSEDRTCRDIDELSAALQVLCEGSSGRMHIHIEESGTALRFVCALAALTSDCELLISIGRRLAMRPMCPLFDALRSLGAQIEETRSGLLITPLSGLPGKMVTIDASQSSQFVSALMLVAPTLPDGLRIFLDRPSVSIPYIYLTADVMTAAAVPVRLLRSDNGSSAIEVPRASYVYRSVCCDADWSAAAFFIVGVCIAATGTRLRFPGLHTSSQQADEAILRICSAAFDLQYCEEEGKGLSVWCTTGLSKNDALPELNLSDSPDLVPALTVACLALGKAFLFKGIAHLCHKESNRLKAVCENANRLGYAVEADADGLRWSGRCSVRNNEVRISSYKDHRIAMAFAMMAYRIPGLEIEGAESVDKSYPQFWRDAARCLGINHQIIRGR